MPNLSTSSILQMVFRLRFSCPLRIRDTYCCVQPKRAARSACDMPSASSLSSIIRAMRRDSRRHASFSLLSSAFSRQRLGVADGNCSSFFTIFSFIADGFMLYLPVFKEGVCIENLLLHQEGSHFFQILQFTACMFPFVHMEGEFDSTSRDEIYIPLSSLMA